MNDSLQLTYKINVPISAEELSTVFKASGIKRPVDDLPRLQRMLDHADITITAWVGEKLAGVARAITDYNYCCYLSDLAVDKTYQKMGIGKEMVRLLQDQIGDEVTLILLASPIAMEYYPRIGFERIDNGYMIARNR
ncbi:MULTISPECIES: GNAT family N-acetyltransferase [Neobacillus]|uniref:GNAT family N-acetyltransferase n=1 Tax=Neobacillus rhizophilus TaxID=2833579 RepID=A0A942U4H7_9BACI|nr:MULTISPECIES: GNAT family N-acetyltransferase [Neobacillus]MBS4214540.1 GNAT family N-acetyltransferase [Neobacillus rhizophilus]